MKLPGLSVIVVGLFCNAAGALSADPAWSLMELRETERPLAGRMKPAQMLEDFEAALQWKALGGGQYAKAGIGLDRDEKHDGRAALRVDYEFVGKETYEYVAVARPLEIPAGVSGIAFWIRRGPASFHLAARIADRTGEIHQFWLEEAPGDGWHFAAGLFRAGSSWGGDGNRRLDPPLRLHSLTFDRPALGFREKGRLWIDNIQAVQPVVAAKSLRIEAQGKRFGNVYRPGETVKLRAQAATGCVGWRVEDFWGAVLARQAATGSNAAVAFRLTRPGFYSIQFDCERDGAVTESRTFRCAALEEIKQPATNAFTGFCTHFGQNAYPIESMDLLKQYGFRRFRDEVAWVWMEKERGRYAMPPHAEKYLAHAKALGMEPLIIFDYANPLHDQNGFPNSPEGIAAFAAYAAELARMTRGVVGEFEIWNEWVGGCGMKGRPGDHSPEAYGKVMKAACAAARAARPDAVIVGIGGEYGPHCAENIERAIRTGGAQAMDAFSIHPYRYPRTPEVADLTGDVGRIMERAAGAGAPRRMWITEIGYPTHLLRGGTDERSQARHAVRTLALLQATPGVEKVHWYDFKDDGLVREHNEHNFGVVLHQQFNCAPKPAAVAMSVFARLTAGAKVVGLQREGGFHAIRYRRTDGSDLIVLWHADGETKASVTGRGLKLQDMMGGTMKTASPVTATQNPIYITGRSVSVKSRANP